VRRLQAAYVPSRQVHQPGMSEVSAVQLPGGLSLAARRTTLTNQKGTDVTRAIVTSRNGASGDVVPLSCAWCLKDAGQPMGSGSHGICARHAADARCAHRATLSARAADAHTHADPLPRRSTSGGGCPPPKGFF